MIFLLSENLIIGNCPIYMQVQTTLNWWNETGTAAIETIWDQNGACVRKKIN